MAGEVNRWIKDQFSRDELIKGRPEGVLKKLERSIETMPMEERLNAKEYARSYVEGYFQGRHNVATPVQMERRLVALETRVDRLVAVDKAREVLARYGPPEKALEGFQLRSDRAREITRTVKEVPTQTPERAPSREQEMQERDKVSARVRLNVTERIPEKAAERIAKATRIEAQPSRNERPDRICKPTRMGTQPVREDKPMERSVSR